MQIKKALQKAFHVHPSVYLHVLSLQSLNRSGPKPDGRSPRMGDPTFLTLFQNSPSNCLQTPWFHCSAGLFFASSSAKTYDAHRIFPDPQNVWSFLCGSPFIFPDNDSTENLIPITYPQHSFSILAKYSHDSTPILALTHHRTPILL